MSRHVLTVSFAGLSLLTALIFFISSLGLPEAAYQLPRILIVLVVLLSLGMVWESSVKRKTEGAETESTPEDAARKSLETRKLGVFVLFIAAYVILLRPVGYFIMTPLFICASYIHLKSTKPLYMALTAIGFTVFVYMLFVLFLHLPVPMGILSGIL